ncbi:hypothetical protein [Occallatibacter riparius]|uniref:Uncharacterized protein n=1 Tax=Occallatibacter riparius TaxID=1002689 RepID=A0A9J7BWE6_9BACT|nr:hypothetical protein [Occallatibacter riparius]UWZ85333.1 hypothetical protein MOP44_05190 [Occallatibacter riparius]
MKPQTVGRYLGVGLRVAGRMAGQSLNAATSSSAPSAPVAGAGGPATTSPSVSQTAKKAGVAAVSVGRGMGGFIKPFRRVGGIVFLEVTGAFFFLFVILFGNWAWKLHADYAHGPDHSKFLVFAALTLVFLYLSVSSFWRAKRR